MKPQKNEPLTPHQVKILKRAYEPYRNEAKTALLWWIILWIIMAIGVVLSFLYGELYSMIATVLLAIYIYIYWRVFHRHLFYPAIEIKFHQCACADLQIIAIKAENTYSSRGFGNIMPELYDKKLHVDRYKIICRNSSGRKIILRCVMSQKRKLLLLDAIKSSSPLPCSVTYGKFTHIIWHFDNKNDTWADTFNHTF